MMPPEILPGRACDGCTLCCKVMSITELAKPQGAWCRHCAIGSGCKIYDERPHECRHFYCGYLTWPMAEDHWRPAKSKMVIVSELGGTRVGVHVDPGKPMAWRDEPYYSDLKDWARHAAMSMMQVVVCIGRRTHVILPDRDVDLGIVEDDERIISWEVRSSQGTEIRAEKLKADDPRIAGMTPGKVFKPSKPVI